MDYSGIYHDPATDYFFEHIECMGKAMGPVRALGVRLDAAAVRSGTDRADSQGLCGSESSPVMNNEQFNLDEYMREQLHNRGERAQAAKRNEESVAHKDRLRQPAALFLGAIPPATEDQLDVALRSKERRAAIAKHFVEFTKAVDREGFAEWLLDHWQYEKACRVALALYRLARDGNEEGLARKLYELANVTNRTSVWQNVREVPGEILLGEVPTVYSLASLPSSLIEDFRTFSNKWPNLRLAIQLPADTADDTAVSEMIGIDQRPLARQLLTVGRQEGNVYLFDPGTPPEAKAQFVALAKKAGASICSEPDAFSLWINALLRKAPQFVEQTPYWKWFTVDPAYVSMIAAERFAPEMRMGSQASGSLGPTPTGSEPAFSHSEDFTSSVWGTARYTFTKGQQAESVRVLWEAWEKGGHSLSQETIAAKIGSDAKRSFVLSKVFRKKKPGGGYEKHPAWGTMIQQDGKGSYRLVPPESSPIPK
jgi:hypothetical protein